MISFCFINCWVDVSLYAKLETLIKFSLKADTNLNRTFLNIFISDVVKITRAKMGEGIIYGLNEI